MVVEKFDLGAQGADMEIVGNLRFLFASVCGWMVKRRKIIFRLGEESIYFFD